MVSRLREKLAPTRLCLSDDYGIPLDAKEAVGFAVLANETVCGNRANVPGVTGARGRYGSRKNLNRGRTSYNNV